jgi:N6-adenosine-specific RNA methylase IME4
MTWPFGALIPLNYDVIVCDPPWAYQHYSERGIKKGAQTQYDCMTVEDIAAAFPIDRLGAPDCLLLLWGTWPLIDRQLECIKAWRFTFKSVVVWQKVFASGKSAIGTGYRVRSMCEPVLLATIGEPRHKAFPGLFPGIRREHSRKPDEFYELVEARAPRLFRRADLFSRQWRPGWHVWGDEVGRFDEVAA